jgi:hypothetical protein
MKSLTFQRLREVNKTAKMHSEIARAKKPLHASILKPLISMGPILALA